MRYYANIRTGKIACTSNRTQYEKNPDAWKRIDEERYERLQRIFSAGEERYRSLIGKHKGATFHVLGNGPSLKAFKKKEDGDLVIGVNSAGLDNELDYWVLLDVMGADTPLKRHWREYAQGSKSKHLVRHAVLATSDLEDWEPYGLFGWACEPTEDRDHHLGLHWRKCSTHAAMDMARIMGAKNIVLWGVDYNDRSHVYTNREGWEDEPNDNPGVAWKDFQHHQDGFRAIGDACRRAGCKVWNANPDSRIKDFDHWPGGIPKLDKPEAVEVKERPRKVVRAGSCVVREDPWKGHRLFTLYTPDYLKYARYLAFTFGEYGVPVHAIPIPKKRSWIATCMQRASIMESLSKVYHDGTMWLLDCDLRAVKDPQGLASWEGDLLVHDRGEDRPDHQRYSAGILAVRHEYAPNLFGQWAKLCKQDRLRRSKVPTREQVYLKEVIERLQEQKLRIKRIGDHYNESPEFAGDDTVILHNPASRETLPDTEDR